MRRGHPARGGWRGESPRHFRPRNGGPPGYRPPRGYAPLQREALRFPPLHRFPYRGPPPFNAPPGQVQQDDHPRPGYIDNNYKFLNRLCNKRDHEKSLLPKHNERPQNESYDKHNDYYEKANRNDRYYVNDMGDVDQRQPFMTQHRLKSYQPRDIPQWSGRSHKTFDRREESLLEGPSNKIPQHDYSGHRPPASDHYEAKSVTTVDNSDTFSRSIDDTVDIIRRKLQTRNDPQIQSTSMNQHVDETAKEPPVDDFQIPKLQQEQTQQRKQQRQRPNVKANCDKIKKSIVHQLFKMDKDRIHRLINNPNSSHKFEYAINSLITESQNSFNSHMRAAAEKSLCGSRNEIMQYNENDTIYEDTFMKQMQCILEPQDTILLEDIKPIVMAELNKVLQLNEFEHLHSFTDDVDYGIRDYQNYQNTENYSEQPYDLVSGEYTGDCNDNSQYYLEAQPYKTPNANITNYDRVQDHTETDNDYESELSQQNDSSALYKRRSSRKSADNVPNRSHRRSRSSERRRRTRSTTEYPLFRSPEITEPAKPYFDVNAEQLSEDDDDPFAELDKQYHVPVDHNFIDDEDPGVSEYSKSSTVTTPDDKAYRSTSSLFNPPIKTEFNHQDLKLPEVVDKTVIQDMETNIKAELLETSPAKTIEQNIIKNEKVNEPKERHDSSKSDLSNSSLNKSSISSNSRKRVVDQRPSHRKEKRKKSESSSGETNKQILNKNIIINLNDCAKKPENCESSGKSIFNLFFSKGQTVAETSKEKKNEGSDSGYSEKYVKRKESPSKPVNEKVSESKKSYNSSSSNHSTSNFKDKSTSLTPSKSDSKTKLQTFDMFVSQPRKSSAVHQLHRNSNNTAKSTSTPHDDKVKTLPLKSISKQVTRKHVSTQVIRKVNSKESQTVENKTTTKLAVRGVQTEPVIFEKSVKKSSNAFERMKEIDMEIQILLQEKFKLYNSLETKESLPDTMPSLGMTVLNIEKTNQNETETESSVDSIVDDFTSIPEQELVQIALESVEPKQSVATPKAEKSTRRQKIQKQENVRSDSPSTRRSKKEKSPNISLLEQIITDDRPLEEIISLDAFETSPIKTRNRKKQPKKLPKKNNKQKTDTPPSDIKYVIRDCYVKLTREDFSHYLTPKLIESIIATSEIIKTDTEVVVGNSTEVIVDPVISDFHFQDDMLDVSEDIVIDSNCEVKLDVKELVASESVIEEVVLDNSHTCEEQATSEVAETQQTNSCKMYDYSADEDLRQDSFSVTGNGDAILAIECIENSFLAACLDGNVYHFNADGQLLNTLRGSNLAVTCLTIVNEKYGTTVYTGSLDSRIRYYDLETGLEKGPECNVLSPIQTMDRAWDTVFVGTRTGFVLQFECKNNMLIPVSTIKFSDQSILALRALKEGPRKVLLVAARSENVTIKDAQTGLLLRTLVGPKMTVYTLLYEDGKIYCGTSSNQIQVFDYASGSHIGKHDGGKGAVCLRAAGGVLFAGCYDGCVYAFRAGETTPFAQLRGPGVMLLSLAVVGTKIIAGYKDWSLYIWKIPINILQEMVL